MLGPVSFVIAATNGELFSGTPSQKIQVFFMSLALLADRVLLAPEDVGNCDSSSPLSLTVKTVVEAEAILSS
jgi:hypothetical protein